MRRREKWVTRKLIYPGPTCHDRVPHCHARQFSAQQEFRTIDKVVIWLILAEKPTHLSSTFNCVPVVVAAAKPRRDGLSHRLLSSAAFQTTRPSAQTDDSCTCRPFPLRCGGEDADICEVVLLLSARPTDPANATTVVDAFCLLADTEGKEGGASGSSGGSHALRLSPSSLLKKPEASSVREGSTTIPSTTAPSPCSSASTPCAPGKVAGALRAVGAGREVDGGQREAETASMWSTKIVGELPLEDSDKLEGEVGKAVNALTAVCADEKRLGEVSVSFFFSHPCALCCESAQTNLLRGRFGRVCISDCQAPLNNRLRSKPPL